MGTLKKNRKTPCVLRDPRWQWERRARSCVKERSAVYMQRRKENPGEWKRRVWHCSSHSDTDSA